MSRFYSAYIQTINSKILNRESTIVTNFLKNSKGHRNGGFNSKLGESKPKDHVRNFFSLKFEKLVWSFSLIFRDLLPQLNPRKTMRLWTAKLKYISQDNTKHKVLNFVIGIFDYKKVFS